MDSGMMTTLRKDPPNVDLLFYRYMGEDYGFFLQGAVYQVAELRPPTVVLANGDHRYRVHAALAIPWLVSPGDAIAFGPENYREYELASRVPGDIGDWDAFDLQTSQRCTISLFHLDTLLGTQIWPVINHRPCFPGYNAEFLRMLHGCPEPEGDVWEDI